MIEGVIAATSPHGVSSSIGGMTFPGATTPIAEMVQLADGLMYRAKTTGKNRVCLEVAAGAAY